MSWISKYLKGKDIPDNDPIESFNSYLKDAMEQSHKRSEKAKKEIKEFEKVTQDILRDIAPHCNLGTYTMMKCSEEDLLNIGKLIDPHIKKILFTKKLEDIVNDKRD